MMRVLEHVLHALFGGPRIGRIERHVNPAGLETPKTAARSRRALQADGDPRLGLYP